MHLFLGILEKEIRLGFPPQLTADLAARGHERHGYGLGFRADGLGFRVEVQGLEFVVWDLGLSIQDSRSRVTKSLVFEGS